MDMVETGRRYEIRWATDTEWAPAMKMIWRTFMKYVAKDYSEEGIRKFFEFVTDDDLYISFLRGEYRLMVALDRGEIIGAGSIRNRNHLSLLFVDENYHHEGVGSTILQKLCDYLETESGERGIFLLASPYAVNFYKKQGFRALGPELENSGIRVTPMEKLF